MVQTHVSKVEANGGIADWQNKLVSSFTAGTPPDVCRYLFEDIPIVAAVERDVVNKLLNDELWTGKSPAAQVTRRIKELGDPFFK